VSAVPLRNGLAALVITLLLDQLSKWWILTVTMAPPRIIPVTDFFNLVLVFNRGVSFGVFGDGAAWVRWALVVFAVLLSIGLFIWLLRARGGLLALGLGLIIGGAIGNVIDRIRFGGVVDFLDFHLSGWHWPAFNVADSAIMVGVMLLIFDSLNSPDAKP